MSEPVYIVAAKRTAVTKAHVGLFQNTRPDDLLAHVISAVLQGLPSVDQEKIDDVIVGCAMPEAEQGLNVARISLLYAGLPDCVPGMTINRFCSSGVQSLAIGADRIAAGRADLILAGGTESMSMIPMEGNTPRFNERTFENNEEHIGIAYNMGITAENVAKKWEITREAQDGFALSSHEKAIKAIENGQFKGEICPFTITKRIANLETSTVDKEDVLVDTDGGPRKETSLEQLAKLKPVFAAKGSITAGNSSQKSDGAGMVVLASEKALKAYNLKPLARFISYDVVGVDPKIMGIGPVEAITKVLKRSGLKLADISWIELNEAFAAQSLAVIHDAKLDPLMVNPHGSAIALGHPLGATGAIRTTTLVHGMRAKKLQYGMVTMCIGTGMGFAAVFEML